MTEKRIIDRDGLNQLIKVLLEMGFQVAGPTLRDEAIVYENIQSINDLPEGWTDEQDGGIYRLKKRSDKALFGYVVGPHSWKKFLHPPEKRLWKATLNELDFEIIPEESEPRKYAFLGVRSCELHAIAIQDKVFLGGDYKDNSYQLNRENAFFIAVHCGQAGGTCFCVSMNTGPRAESGFELALTEVIHDNDHYFVVETGNDRGMDVINKIPNRKAVTNEVQRADSKIAEATAQMGRVLDTTNIKELLYQNLEHPQWDDIANRCLSCANCTMVCPTCFCSTVEDVTDITGDHAERWQKWDSCFTMDFSHLHGGEVRTSTKSRYRQWMTHKLASWQDQFGSSGCVGCGRCITWCPVAIDFTEEVPKICGSENSNTPVTKENETPHENS
jgi:sulfhydrogenase subunit beta (sulfur reductase)